MSDERIGNYREFFDYYLMEHRSPASRLLHFAGTAAATAAVIGAGVMGDPHLLLLALVLGYGPAWTGHFLFERNRPATFRYPLWSLASDYRMLFLWLRGRLGPALEAAAARRSGGRGFA